MEKRRLLKTSIFSLFAVICFSQCYSIISGFLKYPVVIDIFDSSPSLLTILPGITLCNNNRVSLKKLGKRNAAFRNAIESKYPGWSQKQPSFDKGSLFTNFRDDVARIYQEINYDPEKGTENATMNDLFDMKPDGEPFIKFFGCARTWKDSIECNKLTRIDSIQDRRCTTILHKGSKLYDLMHNPHLFNSTRASTGPYSYFDAKEVIKLVIDFEPEDYADLKRQIGSRVIFHDSNHVGSITNLDFYITRGFKYDFNIERKDTKLVSKPVSDCVDYDTKNLAKYKRKIDPRVPLMVDTCFQNCVVQNIINYANCWPLTMPYFRNDSLDPHRNLKPCGWFSRSHQILRLPPRFRHPHCNRTNPHHRMSDDQFKSKVKMGIYNKIKRFCWSQCALACTMSSYAITVTRSAWPSDVQILFDKSGSEKRLLRHCCALVTVKYEHFHYTVHDFKLKYNWADTLGNLGGLLAVWLGISIVSLYRGIQNLIDICTQGSSAKVHSFN